MRTSLDNSKPGAKRARHEMPSFQRSVASSKKGQSTYIEEINNFVLDIRDIRNLMRQNSQPADFSKNVSDVFMKLTVLFSKLGLDPFYEWADSLAIPKKRAQEIAFFVFNIGKITSEIEEPTQLPVDLIEFFLTLVLTSDPTSKALSNILQGIGILVKTNAIAGKLNSELLAFAVTKILNLDGLQSRNISYILGCLGYSAKARGLEGKIDSGLVSQALSTLLTLVGDNEGLFIANSLNQIGYIAKAQCLTGTVDPAILNQALTKLIMSNHPQSQNIANAFKGLANLAQTQHLAGKIDSDLLRQALVRLLTLKDLSSRTLRNSLNDLGYLARAQCLTKAIDSRILSLGLIKMLNLNDLDARSISNYFNGLGYLARAQCLEGKIDSNLVNQALEKLLTLDCPYGQAICNSLINVGYLALGQWLNGKIDAVILNKLLKKLLTLNNLDAQDVSMSLNGLGYLAQTQRLNGAIDSLTLIGAITKLLSSNDCRSQNIANSFTSLARLQENGFIRDRLPSNVMKQLAMKLETLHASQIQRVRMLEHWTNLISPTEQEGFEHFLRIANQTVNFSYLHPTLAVRLLSSLIAYKNHIQDERLDALYQDFLSQITIPLERFSPSAQDSLTCYLTALEAHPTWRSGLEKSLSNSETEITNSITEVEENEIATRRTSNSGTERTHSITEVEENGIATRRTSNSGTERIHSITEVEENEIATRRTQKARRVNRSHNSFFTTERSDSANSKTSAHWNTASQNALFRAISNRNEEELKRLLRLSGQSYPSSLEPQIRKTSDPAGSTSSLRTKDAATERVNQFFNKLPFSALKTLIAQSEAKYFVWLFKACGTHERNQLCQSTSVYVLWQNLPLNELIKLMRKMRSPFAIYINHQSLIHLVDALTIRLAQRPAEREALLHLQTRLLTEGISYHEKCRHIHVVPRLKSLLAEVKKNDTRLLDEESLCRNYTGRFPTHPVTRTPLQAQVVSESTVRTVQTSGRARLFQPAVAGKPQPIIRKDYYPSNRNYFYETEDINKILEYRMAALKDSSIVCLGAVQLQSSSPNARIAALLNDWKANVHLSPDSVTKLIIPIHDTSSNHWVGMQINLQGTEIKELIYFDGLLSQQQQRQQMDIIYRDLVEADWITKPTIIKLRASIKQTDGSSCGALMIENFYCSNKGQLWPAKPNLSMIIRERHLRILQENDPEFFHQFGRRQEKNRPTVQSMAVQEQTHGLGIAPN
ncbi:hypothetical protein Lnau_0310 [Legionella nautarum]|uniref:Ubiquitin-like protease family profile domain-containing protein n=1 Tax=Legionella nautarum TaxID=45070 RepID=A0A0W0X3H1_9GAMM|nr:Ulp1 family isopeptidase [Legionella nautarum]KTD39111.1 hypothetical protein Lnau_0310 [Legionella nautarum]